MSQRDLHVIARPHTRYANSHAIEAWWLRWDVTSKTSYQVLFTLDLMPVYEHERYLNRGRFAHFTHERQEHVAKIWRKHNGVPWPEMVEPWVNWIAENHEDPWSLSIDMENVHVGTFSFSFANPTIGTMFKLAMA